MALSNDRSDHSAQGHEAQQAPVVVHLRPDEALVLFDWIHRTEEERQFGSVTEHPAEIAALWALSCVLESTLVGPFRLDYKRLVDEARRRLIAS
jgi:hypothetical protein